MKFLSMIFVCGLFLNGSVEAKITPEIQATIGQLEKFSEAFSAIAAEVTPGVVAVVNKKTEQVLVRGRFNNPLYEYLYGVPLYRREQKQEQGLGSGVIVSKEGYVLTNNHVIAGADEIVVELADGRSFEAKLLGTDPQSDVAVLKVTGENLPVVKMGDSDELKVGAWILAIGNPFGLRHTVTSGIVSAIGRGNLQLLDYEDFIQTDAAINPGNSGGAMVNMRGELIGINTAILSRSGGNQGVGFAVPINMVRNIMDQIITHGKVVRGYLDVAVQDVTPGMAEALGIKSKQGALVQDVAVEGVAEGAGLQRGDVIVSVNGRAVRGAEEFRTRIAQTPPGTNVRLEVMRKGKKQTVHVQLSGLDDQMVRADLVARREAELGVEVQELTPELARRSGYSISSGVVITDVHQSRATQYRGSYGMRRGDVIVSINDQAIQAMDDYVEALVGLTDGDEIWLRIRREYRTSYRTFDVGFKLPK
ncbi:MAG: Do family serine endopeptidase [Candidatus Latescibacteria bacterium]|nr:Do family serine endopeptidase [Candidatus Latescibacterota bacterium]